MCPGRLTNYTSACLHKYSTLPILHLACPARLLQFSLFTDTMIAENRGYSSFYNY